MNVIVVYDNIRDKELLDNVNLEVPFFIKYINFNSVEGRKEAYRVKSPWAAIKNPFVLLKEGEEILKVFYSEKGINAINQLISYINESSNKET